MAGTRTCCRLAPFWLLVARDEAREYWLGGMAGLTAREEDGCVELTGMRGRTPPMFLLDFTPIPTFYCAIFSRKRIVYSLAFPE